MREIKVKVVEFGDRLHYRMQFVDPLTNRKKTKSTGVLRAGDKKVKGATLRAGLQ